MAKLLVAACWKGTRLWPLSIASKPKQFVNLGDISLVRLTSDRFRLPKEDVFYLTLPQYQEILLSQCQTDSNQIVYGDPNAKENFKNIRAWLNQMASKWVSLNETIILTWSDNYIANHDKFLTYINEWLHYIDENPWQILLYACKPSKPSTQFGYIECSDLCWNIKKVISFREKPDLKTAQIYLDKGNYLWNMGTFIFKLGNILDIIDSLCPWNPKDYDKPIDKVIFEKCSNMACYCTQDIWWNDVWTFESFYEVSPKDKDWNSVYWCAEFRNAQSNLVVSESKNVVIEWLNNVVVIEKNWIVYIRQLK